ncbi:hypothetical protein SynBIOSE41_02394 [Synechococcus sp. BIOS-E4-1]|nr:hypothetical protein SynBIOSE41_02394 [Synechococcus sp. BIOS-E4-1]
MFWSGDLSVTTGCLSLIIEICGTYFWNIPYKKSLTAGLWMDERSQRLTCHAV